MKYRMLNEQMLHGGDYNPDQWLDEPGVLEKDIELFRQAGINCASVGIFSWAKLEPEEGKYDFEWLSQVIDRLYENGIYTVLATPSGARPAWMAKAHPEVLRVNECLVRNEMGGRHNHCYTSPYFRQKIWDMDYNLSRRFGAHPGVILWHISNEFGGECYCPLCRSAFREWLKEKYKTLDNLNHAWWTAFWSHTYTAWEQIDPPLVQGENSCHGLQLDWRRFVTHQTADFCAWEKQAIRAGGSTLPVTTNFMDFFDGLDYRKFKDVVDITSWDNYPRWHGPDGDIPAAVHAAACHDWIRSVRHEPFLLMESTPSAVNWQPICRLKRPGMHELSSLQAVAHGSNSVQYFQLRKSRGCSEKFHGALIGHDGTGNTRVFREAACVGKRLASLSALCGTMVSPKVAIIYDTENSWAIDYSQALLNGPGNKHYLNHILQHYEALWRMGINVDLINMDDDLSGYKLVIAPMLYMQRGDIVQRLRDFVQQGGTLVGGYWSGLADENDLCFRSFAPNGLQDVFGLYSEEIDALYPEMRNGLTWENKTYPVQDMCDLVQVQTAKVLGVYSDDFYKNQPALCVNEFGQGKAWYLCSRPENMDFYRKLYEKIVAECGIPLPFGGAKLPENVTVSERVGGGRTYLFVMNFNFAPVSFEIPAPALNIETGKTDAVIDLGPYEIKIYEY